MRAMPARLVRAKLQSGTRRPSLPTLNRLGGGDVSSPASHALATQNFLGRDVPAPTRSINYFGVGDVPSPHLPRPHNARHQSGTSPARPQPVFKTLKGFQTVAGGKAVRPPPPVPRPQNPSPLRSRRGLGVVASPRLRKPSLPMNRDARRDHGDERKLVERASLGANVLCARRGPAHFCVFLRALRACASYREA